MDRYDFINACSKRQSEQCVHEMRNNILRCAGCVVEEALERLNARVPEARATEQEPVAWRYKEDPSSVRWRYAATAPTAPYITGPIEPLYPLPWDTTGSMNNGEAKQVAIPVRVTGENPAPPVDASPPPQKERQ